MWKLGLRPRYPFLGIYISNFRHLVFAVYTSRKDTERKIQKPTCSQSIVVEFIDSDWGDKVNSGIGLSYRPARLHWLASRYDNLKLELTLSPSHGSLNSALGTTPETLSYPSPMLWLSASKGKSRYRLHYVLSYTTKSTMFTLRQLLDIAVAFYRPLLYFHKYIFTI